MDNSTSSALEAAANELHRRHEMLRAVFLRVDDRVVQHTQPASPVSLHVLHLSPMPLEEKRREAKRLMTEAARPSRSIFSPAPCIGC